MTPSTRLATRLAAGLVLGLLALQAGAAVQCSALNTAFIPAGNIGLPTRGAQVASATVVQATASTAEYCKVRGAILPVDPQAQVIEFQVNLPLVWNHKSLQFGGGGFDGSLITGEKNLAHAPANSKSPLQRGYTTFGSDSGHKGLGSDGSFARNEETLRNFAGQAIKKLRDVAQQLMLQRYGMGPAKAYMAGGSSGGRETLFAIQHWPNDYDGAIVHYPALQWTSTGLQGNRIAKALYAPGGFVNSAKMEHLNNQVLAACDTLDGVADGLIHNVAACQYDPAVLRCDGNVDWGPTCLTDAQLNTVRTINTPMALGFTLANGIQATQGYNILAGANFGGPVDVGLISQPLNPAVMPLNGFVYTMQSEWLKYFVTGDASYNSLLFTPQTAGIWQARVQQLSGWQDATALNLTPFEQRGGKILMLHGTADTVISPRGSIDYVNRLQQRYGAAALRQFLRFYTVAGFGHGEGRYNATWAALDLLEDWAERASPPVNPTSKDVFSLTGRSRPLCEHPQYPRYRTGPVNLASSFDCAMP